MNLNSKASMKVFKAFMKPFEAPKRSVKIKISVNFFALPGIETGRVKTTQRSNYSKLVEQRSH